MADGLKNIEWDDLAIAIPAFLIIALMPFTYSISTGIAFGFLFYCLSMFVVKRSKEVHPILYIVTLLFFASYVLNALI